MISSRTLTFAERVGYQYVIEEVYWRHRIWPKDNPVPKPPLDAMVSRREMEKKVEDYLRKSQQVAAHRGAPITASELQAEMERMASHSRQPEVLRELFAALGNAPFVIAECLTRPILAERLANELNVRTNGRDGSLSRPLSSANDAARSAIAPYQTAYKLPEISIPNDCIDDTWAATTTANAPAARFDHTAVWTGSEMIIWGGFNFSSGNFNTGRKYNPATDTWTATSMTNVPSVRARHSAVWTGIEMIVWGGGGSNMLLNTGGKYNPVTGSWTTTSTVNAPAARNYHTAVWSGSEMIVWGGNGCGGNCQWNTGGKYNPNTDGWVATSTTSAPVARFLHSALWTGSQMIVWGGSDRTNYLHTGARYDPMTNSWTPTNLANVPPGRIAHTAVWTGSEMIVWGGVADGTFTSTNTGGRYNPSTDSWLATGVANGAPLARNDHSAVWTGSEMIVWGGNSPGGDFNTGKRYNPGADTWTPMATVNAPLARARHTAVWTGNEMIMWGGLSSDAGFELNTGGTYCAQPSTPLVQSAVSRKAHGNLGTFDVDLPLSGTPGIECRSGGATNDYAIVVTFLANVSVQGNPQATVTSGIGTIGSGGVRNGGRVSVSGNAVTIPLTNVANAQTINVTLNNVNGATTVMIPMSVLLGDANGNGAVNASDIGLVKARSGQAVDPTTFRCDINADDSINATDISFVKALAGTGLP